MTTDELKKHTKRHKMTSEKCEITTSKWKETTETPNYSRGMHIRQKAQRSYRERLPVISTDHNMKIRLKKHFQKDTE